jgi:hypothetical protein
LKRSARVRGPQFSARKHPPCTTWTSTLHCRTARRRWVEPIGSKSPIRFRRPACALAQQDAGARALMAQHPGTRTIAPFSFSRFDRANGIDPGGRGPRAGLTRKSVSHNCEGWRATGSPTLRWAAPTVRQQLKKTGRSNGSSATAGRSYCYPYDYPEISDPLLSS